MLLTDQNNRELAIDPNQSFIIEAPAGSGKTSLLIQRYLVLLTKVNHPEEILAITFTRKAASEMRSRVLATLNHALDTPAPKDQHQLKLWHLATAALKRNQEAGWNLIENPNRLRIQTIDSFCRQLAQQLPLRSSLGTNLNLLKEEELLQCYRQAVRYLLNSLDEFQDLANLLLHLDNDCQKTEKLLVNMLACRDQWLPHIVNYKNSQELRSIMENSLDNVIKENLINCQNSFPQELFTEIKALTEYATSLVTELNDPKSWQEIGKLLLTQKFQWRKLVDARCGFPAASSTTSKEKKPLFKTMKQRMEVLLEQLSGNEDLRKNLEVLLHSPPSQYSDQQWKIILSLINVLKILAAYYLPQAFRKYQAIDYIEIALAAERTLEFEGTPTDLALQLDYRLRHILVDEFQDTSTTQYRLLEKLTAGWQLHDGHTLFLVGDPMQSIYKFREAKVGLFLRTKKQQRINAVSLIPLTLSANFRSEQPLVDWVNNTLINVFPKTENIGYGAVTFIPSVTTKSCHSSAPMSFQRKLESSIKLYSTQSYSDEAQRIIAIIQQTIDLEPEDSIAILVRSRNHLTHIIPALKQAGIIYQAIELEPLKSSRIIKDLLALTQALLNLSDQVAWLSILRAPWCGLTLADLHTLSTRKGRLSDNANEKHAPLWSALIDYQHINLSPDAKIRLAHVMPILTDALATRSQKSMRQWIKNTWLKLNGNSYLAIDELENAEKYFNLLATQDAGGYIEDVKLLEEQLKSLYADSKHADDTKKYVQIMTIHKAKGLEFDTVIIPALDRKSKSSSQELLMWAERPNAFDSEIGDLILAPITEIGQEQDSIYNYLRFEDQQKEYNELSRLLYVATTRAKKRLHLLACFNKITESVAPAGSLLEQLWPYFEKPSIKNTDAEIVLVESPLNILARLPISSFTCKNTTTEKVNSMKTIDPTIKSLDNTAFLPHNNITFLSLNAEAVPLISHNTTSVISRLDRESSLIPPLDKKLLAAQNIGIVIHQHLQYLSTIDLEHWLEKNLSLYRSIWRTKLIQLGTFENLDTHVNHIANAIKLTLEDPKGRWILDRHHEEAKSEYQLTTVLNGIPKDFIIDRTFVDQNIRWIIDYKTSLPNGNESLEDFFNQQEQLYQAQLQKYAYIIKQIDNKTINTGLYFTMMGKLVECI
jgi:ATP-dependent helicase/nuclease subunit A